MASRYQSHGDQINFNTWIAPVTKKTLEILSLEYNQPMAKIIDDIMATFDEHKQAQEILKGKKTLAQAAVEAQAQWKK